VEIDDLELVAERIAELTAERRDQRDPELAFVALKPKWRMRSRHGSREMVGGCIHRRKLFLPAAHPVTVRHLRDWRVRDENLTVTLPNQELERQFQREEGNRCHQRGSALRVSPHEERRGPQVEPDLERRSTLIDRREDLTAHLADRRR
jgi:hypothetical protein